MDNRPPPITRALAMLIMERDSADFEMLRLTGGGPGAADYKARKAEWRRLGRLRDQLNEAISTLETIA